MKLPFEDAFNRKADEALTHRCKTCKKQLTDPDRSPMDALAGLFMWANKAEVECDDCAKGRALPGAETRPTGRVSAPGAVVIDADWEEVP